MNSLSMSIAVLIIGLPTAGTHAQQSPSTPTRSPTILKSCNDLKADALRECQKVAREVERSADSSHSATPTASSTTTHPSYVQHSSPIMITREELVVSEAVKKGEDPKKALDELKKSNERTSRSAEADTAKE